MVKAKDTTMDEVSKVGVVFKFIDLVPAQAETIFKARIRKAMKDFDWGDTKTE